MKIELFNFFLRPLHEDHSCLVKTASLITALALTIFTGGLYVIPMLVAHLRANRNVIVGPVSSQSIPQVAQSVRVAAPVYQRRNYGAVITRQLGDPSVDKVALVKMKQTSHLVKLQALADGDDWASLQMHTMHPDSGFDWWMFPVDRPSASWGSLYALNAADVASLKADAAFMNSYREGVILVAKSWGWDLENNEDITDSVQRWTGYNVRLGKMLQSLTLFGESDLKDRLAAFVEAHQLRSGLDGWILPYLQ